MYTLFQNTELEMGLAAMPCIEAAQLGRSRCVGSWLRVILVTTFGLIVLPVVAILALYG